MPVPLLLDSKPPYWDWICLLVLAVTGPLVVRWYISASAKMENFLPKPTSGVAHKPPPKRLSHEVELVLVVAGVFAICVILLILIAVIGAAIQYGLSGSFGAHVLKVLLILLGVVIVLVMLLLGSGKRETPGDRRRKDLH